MKEQKDNSMFASNIEPMLVVCTSHIRQSTSNWLHTQELVHTPILVLVKRDYGWFIYVPENLSELEDDIPFELAYLLHIAAKHNCSWLLIDRDQQEHAALPKFEWK